MKLNTKMTTSEMKGFLIGVISTLEIYRRIEKEFGKETAVTDEILKEAHVLLGEIREVEEE